MLHVLIITLGLHIILSENPAMNCNFYNSAINGCRFGNNIVVAYQPEGDTVDHIFKHEVCHAVINQDRDVLTEAGNLPDLRSYIGYSDQEINDEKAADYCVDYFNQTLDKRYNVFKELMDRKTGDLLVTGTISNK